MQTYRASTPLTEKRRLSIPFWDNNFEALRSGFSGTAFPTDPAPIVGQRCFRTDLQSFYTYIATDTWVRDLRAGETVLVFATIAALRAAYAAEWYANGQNARLLGSSAAGDRMAIDVVWNSSSTITGGALDNADTNFRPVNGAANSGAGRWIRVTPTLANQRNELKVFTRNQSGYVLADRAALRAMEWTGADVPGFVRLRQWLNPGDDGAILYFDSGDTSSSDNGYSIICDSAPSGGNRWRAEQMIRWDARRWGVVFDGSTHIHTALQNAMNDIAALGGGHELVLPAGTGILGGALTPVSGVRLRGRGSSKSILKAKNGLNATMISGAGKSDVEFVDLRIDGNAGNQSAGNGAHFDACQSIKFRDVDFYNILGAGIEVINNSSRFKFDGAMENIGVGGSANTHGVYVADSTVIDVRGRFLEMSQAGSAVNYARCSHGVVGPVICKNTTLRTGGYPAIRFSNQSTRCRALGGTIEGFCRGLLFISAVRCSASGFDMVNIGAQAIAIFNDDAGSDGSSDNCNISDCTIEYWGQQSGGPHVGVLIRDSHRNKVHDLNMVGDFNGAHCAEAMKIVHASGDAPVHNEIYNNKSRGHSVALVDKYDANNFEWNNRETT